MQTAITMGQVAEPYIPLKAIVIWRKGRVVISGAGARYARISHWHCHSAFFGNPLRWGADGQRRRGRRLYRRSS